MDSGITVTGTGQATAPADLLRLTLSVGHDAADVAAAVAQVALRTDAVHAALSAQGVAAEEIETSSVNVYPQYADSMAVAGYRASHSLTVKTRDLTGFGRLLNAAVDAAGNNLGLDHLQFDVADKLPLMERARELAFAQARTKAAQLAALADQSLGSIAAVAESYSHAPFAMLGSAGKASDAYRSELAVTPGEQTIEVSLEVRWSWAR
ncbi:SIMPL domain-containing protein [Kribbella catacumbae]|uniref:SIMPL domain-containing protein n=1 Tax=Kribbella catacumbae TaxID=460086 RepID=UPI00035DBFA9|nr:SIMPL domain-containing protein [Kribbella catacumbae]